MNIPRLRFNGFQGEWPERKIAEILQRVSHPVNVELNVTYRQIGIRSHGKGIFHKDHVTGKALGNKRVFWLDENLFVLNIVFAWEQAVAKTTISELGMIASHRFPMYKPRLNQAAIDYVLHFFLTDKGKHYLGLASPGGAGRNKTLGQKTFEALTLNIPDIVEQTKISNFLSLINEKINQLTLKYYLLSQYKKGLMQQIFSQKLRFKDDDGHDFPEWNEQTIDELLDYEQPTKYLVNTTEYSSSYATPVLTAGKKFILGYTNETKGICTDGLPVIIFDDFTTAFKYVTFPFKAKSSAMKILRIKNSSTNSIKYIYEAMQLIDFPSGDEHKRYWISEYSKLTIPVPCYKEQTKIASFLTAIDNKLTHTQNQLSAAKQYNQGLLQQMFV